jgi:hypothetical protein
MDVIAADQRENPDKEYLAWWECDGPFDPGENPHYEVQQVDSELKVMQDPVATLWYTADEFADRTFLDHNPNPDDHATTLMHAPWTVEPSSEAASDAWSTTDATKERICSSGARAGECYVRIHPDGGDSTTWIYQNPLVANSSKSTADSGGFTRHPISDDDGYQYDGVFQCPEVSENGFECYVDIWLRAREDNKGWDSDLHRRSYSVPADDNTWYYIVREDWAAPDNYEEVTDLYINTNGDVLDVDTQWVSNGIRAETINE